MASNSAERTTITVGVDLHQRLVSLKPYETISFDEFLAEMADEWESESDQDEVRPAAEPGGCE